MLHDDKIFQQSMINLNDIITWDVNQYKSCSTVTYTYCIDDNLDNIHSWTTRPPNHEEKKFTKLFQNDIHKLMNTRNQHPCNPTCYKIDVHTFTKKVGMDSFNL